MSDPRLDPVEQNRRALYLQALYRLDGRHDKAHPQHGFYTGLYQKRIKSLVGCDMDLILNGEADD